MLMITIMIISTNHDDHHQGPSNVGQPASGGPSSCRSSEGRDLFVENVIRIIVVLVTGTRPAGDRSWPASWIGIGNLVHQHHHKLAGL